MAAHRGNEALVKARHARDARPHARFMLIRQLDSTGVVGRPRRVSPCIQACGQQLIKPDCAFSRAGLDNSKKLQEIKCNRALVRLISLGALEWRAPFHLSCPTNFLAPTQPDPGLISVRSQ